MTTKNKIAWALLWTALILWSGVKDWKADNQVNHIEDTKWKVSEVLKQDPMKQLPVDLSKEIVKWMAINDTRQELLIAKLETNKENGEYGEFLNSLMSFWKNNIKKQEYIDRFNKLDENQKRFAEKLYKAWKNDPVLLTEKSNGWLAINCIWLMERVTNLKHVIQTWDLENWKTSDLWIQLELVLEHSPNTQSVLTPKVVAWFKDIETSAILRIQEELKIAKEELAKSKEEWNKLDESNIKLSKEIEMLNALLFTSR